MNFGYCSHITIPRGVLAWICQNPETYKPKFHCRRQSVMNFGYVTANGVNSNCFEVTVQTPLSRDIPREFFTSPQGSYLIRLKADRLNWGLFRDRRPEMYAKIVGKWCMSLVIVHTPLSREVFWHEYAKIPRHTSQNSIAAGNLEWILAQLLRTEWTVTEFIRIS